MAYDESLAERIRTQLRRKRGFTEKKMFGGVGFLLHGHMCVGIWKESLVVRLGPAGYDAALDEPHVRPFDITGKAMTGWVLVEPPGIADDEDLRHWIGTAVRFVGTLPPK